MGVLLNNRKQSHSHCRLTIAAGSRFGYTGEYLATETGIWHLRARDLDPATGRFLSADTVQPNAPGTQGFNLYTYTANNPTTWVDPSGHSVLPQMLFSLENAGNELGGFALAIAKVFLYIACILDGQCREDLDEYAAILGQYSSEMPESYQWTIDKLMQMHDMLWPLIPYVDSGLPYAVSIALGMTPVAGDIYDAVTAILGYDPLTGETLSGWERGLALAAALLPFIAAAHLRAASTALDGLGDLAYLANRACSFDEDTPVATADGPIPIAEIDIGDQVLAYDEATGATAYYTVTATMSHMDPVVVTLTIDGEQIETTPEHPFYAAVSAPWLAVGQTAWRWTPAAELEAGDRVYQSDGTTGVVQALVVEAAPQLMYNMTVAQAHTYAVGDGQWVVHNSCNWLRGGKSSDRIGNILAKDAQFFWNQLPRGHKTVIAVAQGGDHKIVTAFIGASDDALKTLEKFASQRGAKYIAPFEDPSIWGSGHAEQVAYNYFRQYFSNATDLRIGVSHPDGPCGRYCRPFFSRENFFRVFWQ